MKFIVGIGNAEPKYDGTRHNVGFGALDGLIGTLELESQKRLRSSKKFQAEIFTADAALLIKPLTFVNRTGDCVSAVLREYRASAPDFLFLCDDVNLSFGKLRLRDSGSAGGHHGLESVIEAFGSEDFSRLRIGVGGEMMPKDDLTDYVLGKFDSAEKQLIGGILGKVVSICKTWMNEGFEPAMNRLSQLQSV